MAKSPTPHYIAQIKLHTGKKDETFLLKVFRCSERIEQKLQAFSAKSMKKLQMDKEYLATLREYRAVKEKLKADQENEELEKQRKALGKHLSDTAAYYGLCKSFLEHYVKEQQHRAKSYVNSLVAQKIVLQVMASINSCLYGKGNRIRFRRGNTLMSIESKNRSGIIYKRTGKYTGNVTVCGRKIQLKQIRQNDEWLLQVLDCVEEDLCYCRIVRRPCASGYQYYLQLVMKGFPPLKHAYGTGRGGIDEGVSSSAVCCEDGFCMLEALDEGVKDTDREIRRILRKMDRSRRAMNPENYDDCGRIRPGKKQWKKSGHYRALQRKYRALCRKRAECLKQIQEYRANRILEHATELYTEKMNWQGLARRAKKTEKRKDDRYKRKRRFGGSIGARAPAQQLAIIDRKLHYIGKELHYVNTRTFKASQYNHLTDTCKKKKLSKRYQILQGHWVQRDLYSAFLLMCSDEVMEHADRTLCLKHYDDFLKAHDRCIDALRKKEKRLSSFGLSKVA